MGSKTGSLSITDKVVFYQGPGVNKGRFRPEADDQLGVVTKSCPPFNEPSNIRLMNRK